MRHVRFLLVAVVALATAFLNPSGESSATPTVGGATPVFSVRDIGLGDITPAVNGFGLTCAAGDLLLPPTAVVSPPCAARPAPLAAFPVPDSVTESFVDLGLDGPAGAAGAFIDELDAISARERLNTGAVDFDFSVDTHPAQIGNTLGVPGCGPAPNVGTEAAAVGGPEAQGDIFTTTAVPGCNFQSIDEAALGLVAPNVALPNVCAPGSRPCDDVDALMDVVLPIGVGPCSVGGLPYGDAPCIAYSVSGASAILGAIPAAVGAGAADEGSILVPPSSPPVPPRLPAACTPPFTPVLGVPCVAVHSSDLGLVPAALPGPADDLDALCWFDANGNMLPDLPNTLTPGIGDYYIFSLAPGSASTLGFGGVFSPADLLTTSGFGVVGPPVVVRTAASLGLLPADGVLPDDNVDALICHDRDGDFDGAPDVLDNCDMVANPVQADTDLDGIGDDCDTEGPPGNSNGLGGMDDCTDGVDNDADGATDGMDSGCFVAGDSDGDTVLDDVEDDCGSDKMDATSIPERVDNPFSPDDDEDNDGSDDEALPSPGSDDSDCDQDGYTGTAEASIYDTGASTVSDQDPCGTNANPPTDPPSPIGWPADLHPGGIILPSINKVDIQDLQSFLAPVRYLDTDVGDIAGNERWDLLPGPGVFGSDINIQDYQALYAGTESTPPMLGGVRALDGPDCPWPP